MGLLVLAVLAGGAVAWILHRYGSDLPDYQRLADYEPPTATRVHAGDGRLIGEFSRERRIFVPFAAIPARVTRPSWPPRTATSSRTPGSTTRASSAPLVNNVANLGSDRRPEGGSTITQQVAKNILLTNEVTLGRKLKEAILAQPHGARSPRSASSSSI